MSDELSSYLQKWINLSAGTQIVQLYKPEKFITLNILYTLFILHFWIIDEEIPIEIDGT